VTRTWWAAAALLAIFAMHGLATHASAAGPAVLPAPEVGTTAATHTGHATHGAHTAHTAHSASIGDEVLAEAATWAPASHGDDHGAMQVLGLCLAVLATAAIALLRAARTRPGLVALLPRATGARTPSAARHDLGPPDLHSLSILRC
jgi:hypothetical protein